MNISRNEIDDLNSVLKIVIEKNDYEERVEKTLRDYRRKARIDGFRPGKVPFGLISKMYRKPVLVEEVNNILNEVLTKYIVDEKLNILGEPLPSETNPKEIDWDNDTSFEFMVDIALSPDFDVQVSSKDKFTFYQIKVDDKIRNEYTDRYASRLGSLKEIDASDETSVIRADVSQVDKEGNVIENGIRVEDATITIANIRDEKIRKRFTGLKTGNELTVNLKKAFSDNAVTAAVLKIKTEEVELINNEFKITVKSVSRFEKAEINQDFYDKLFGKDVVKTEDEFNSRIDEIIHSELSRDSEYKLRLDIREYYIARFRKNLPEGFLKRWLFEANRKKYSKEQIEKDFDHFLEDLKWQLIKDKIGTANNLKVTDEELLEYAKGFARMQFSQYYGVSDFPDDHLANYASELLKKDEERRKLAERKFEEKIIDFIRKTAKLDHKQISYEKFNKLLEK
ncbi:MAG: trigger factor [Bacteroidales bacterium]|nr:trigger factor [Bacteroidales bacterium]